MIRETLSKRNILITTVSLLMVGFAVGQSPTYPEPSVDQSTMPSSPNAQGFQAYGNEPVALFEGTPSISIPIYVVKCGALSLPISLSYNYTGLFPLQDAGWVGLGWNLNAGGVVSRIVEGGVDNSENSGYNYGQYNLHDTIFQSTDLEVFMGKAYNNNLGYSGNAYDLAPDIFDAEFNGNSGKFFWINGKGYCLSYNKDLGISWPSPTSNITITTTDGTKYTFGAQEITTYYYYGGADSTHQSFTSAWFLTMVVSADLKDTIKLNYASYTWNQSSASYQTSYVSSTGTQNDLGSDPTSFLVSPTIQTQILQSIQCRNSRVSFVPDGSLRTDVQGSSPRLREIDVIDSLSGNLVKKNTLSYEYFGQTSTNPTLYERLALKTFSSSNSLLGSDSLTYVFKYISEYLPFPLKGGGGIDYWGYNNPLASVIPGSGTCPYYQPIPKNGILGGNRVPNFAYCSFGALDTIVYPAGGYTAFQYQQNQFNGTSAGPGICLQSSTTFSNNPTSPPLSQKNYTYLLDDGVTSSGVLTSLPAYIGYPFTLVTTSTNNYNLYKFSNNGGGTGGPNGKFYYQKVTETISSNGETHKSDHYFTCYPELFLDVRQTKQIDYVNTVNTSLFTPISKSVTSYNYTIDTSFITASAYIDSEYVNASHNPKIWYGYSDTYNYWYTYWVYPVSQQTTQYDTNGDSLVNTLSYFFNPTTRNLSYTQAGTSDGQTVTQKFKYPEDYSSSLTGNMVSSRVLSSVIETEAWMKRDANDSSLISGNVTVYDQNIFKPVSSYSIETTSPIASLNNQTFSGGLFTSILCDSRYILKGQLQYDANNNPSVITKASDINVSYIWDYRHGQPIANVKNAAQADIAYTSFEADGKGNWGFTGTATASNSSPTGSFYYNLGQSNGNITKSGLTSATTYLVSYWTTSSSALTITGTISGYPIKGKTINGWTYYEHKITGQTSVTISGSNNIDELRLYPVNAQMVTFTYVPLIGISSQCDADNRVTYYQYDGFGRLKIVLDQDHNIIKTIQYHFNGETNE
jgi:hypothetical protein